MAKTEGNPEFFESNLTAWRIHKPSKPSDITIKCGINPRKKNGHLERVTALL